MSQINLNPAVQPALPQVMPAVPTTGMSTVAKLVLGVAALFFATFIYIAFSKSSKPSSSLSCKPKDNDETTLLKMELSKHQSSINDKEAGLVSEFIELSTKEGNFTQGEKTRARVLLGQLSGAPTSPARPQVEESREIRGEQDVAFAAGLHEDRKKSVDRELQKLTEEFTSLYTIMAPFNYSMEMFRRICSNYSREDLVVAKPRGQIMILAIFKAKTSTCTKLDITRIQVETNKCWKVDEFNKKYAHEDFNDKRAALEKAYQTYLEGQQNFSAYESWKIIFDEASKEEPDLDRILGLVTPKGN